jgi:hypothetical protein
MNSSGSTLNFTSMNYPARNVAFLSGPYGYSLRASIRMEDQRIASLNHHHVFVELMHMGRRNSRFAARPERHLASFRPIEHIPFYPRRSLALARDPIGRSFHKFRKFVHSAQCYLHSDT